MCSEAAEYRALDRKGNGAAWKEITDKTPEWKYAF